MTAHIGNSNKLNQISGCSSILEIDSTDTTLYDKVLPKNMILKDVRTDMLYITDGVSDIEEILDHPLNGEITAAEVSAITSLILD
jgi:hypothetical protein